MLRERLIVITDFLVANTAGSMNQMNLKQFVFGQYVSLLIYGQRSCHLNAQHNYCICEPIPCTVGVFILK